MKVGTDELGRRIAAARTLRGLGQKDLAAEVGMADYTLGKIERGERPVQAGELFAIAAALSVPVDWFRMGPGWPDDSEDSGAWLTSLLEGAA